MTRRLAPTGRRQRVGLLAGVVVASVTLSALGLSGAAATAGPVEREAISDAPPNSRLQHDVDKLRDIGTTGVLAVTTNGTQITRARSGVAEVGTTRPVDWESHVRIASNTKTFVATVLLQLEAEGKLSLNDTVERWLPGVVQGNGNRGERITIHQLLQQTSGLFDYVQDAGFGATITTPAAFYQNRFRTWTPEQLVSIAMSHAPTSAPGARWAYSNTNYILAGMVIEAVSGKSWATEVRDRIITPLGLTGTSEPGNDAALPAPFANGYQLFGTDGTLHDVTLHNMTWGGAAGSLISKPLDVNRFFKALMQGRLLPPAQLAKMQTTVPMGRDASDGEYGLGLMRYDLPCGGVYWSHAGDALGFNNTNGVTPDGQRSAVVANLTNTFADPVFAENSIRYSEALVEHALCASSNGEYAGQQRTLRSERRADGSPARYR